MCPRSPEGTCCHKSFDVIIRMKFLERLCVDSITSINLMANDALTRVFHPRKDAKSPELNWILYLFDMFDMFAVCPLDRQQEDKQR